MYICGAIDALGVPRNAWWCWCWVLDWGGCGGGGGGGAVSMVPISPCYAVNDYYSFSFHLLFMIQ